MDANAHRTFSPGAGRGDPLTITLTWQSIITAGAVVGALVTIITLLARLVRWVDKLQAKDADIKALQAKHDEDIKSLQHEQTLIVYGVLAALKGLREQGCNGPVTEAIDKIEKYLNQKAHDEE